MIYHYLNKSIPGYYIDYDYELAESDGNRIGTTYQDFQNGNTWIKLSEEQWQFKQDNPGASPKEVIEMQLRVATPEEILGNAKQHKIQEATSYFNSTDVKSLKYDDKTIWADKQERTELIEKCNQAIRNNVNSISILGIDSISPNIGLNLIDSISDYEEDCQTVFNTKINDIGLCTTVEEVELIDSTSGYPDKISVTSEQVKNKIKDQEAAKPENQAILFSRSIINNFSISANDSLKMKSLYPVWGESNAQMGKQVKAGFKFQYGELLYEVISDHSLSAEWIPGTGTESMYKVVQEEHLGTIDDPIPWTPNMEMFKDKYYTESDLKYLCIRDSGIALSYTLAELVQAGYVELVS